VVFGYTLLGACWLILKTEGEVQARARRIALITGAVTVAMIGIVSLVTPFLEAAYFERWFRMPTMLYLAPVPSPYCRSAVLPVPGPARPGADLQPFMLSLGLFALCFVGLCVSMWPYIIPTSVTLWEAAAPASSQLFMLVGALVLLPLILGYTAYAYWVFRGKLDPDAGLSLSADVLRSPKLRALGWFVILWLAGVAAVATLAWGLRLILS
jgi:cytochrome d ubiquinol oxidase subunit II